jgi:hypothetical protein
LHLKNLTCVKPQALESEKQFVIKLNKK